MREMLVLVENKKTDQFTFLSIHPDNIDSLRKRLGDKWEVRVMTKHLRAREAHQNNGRKD